MSMRKLCRSVSVRKLCCSVSMVCAEALPFSGLLFSVSAGALPFSVSAGALPISVSAEALPISVSAEALPISVSAEALPVGGLLFSVLLFSVSAEALSFSCLPFIIQWSDIQCLCGSSAVQRSMVSAGALPFGDLIFSGLWSVREDCCSVVCHSVIHAGALSFGGQCLPFGGLCGSSAIHHSVVCGLCAEALPFGDHSVSTRKLCRSVVCCSIARAEALLFSVYAEALPFVIRWPMRKLCRSVVCHSVARAEALPVSVYAEALSFTGLLFNSPCGSPAVQWSVGWRTAAGLIEGGNLWGDRPDWGYLEGSEPIWAVTSPAVTIWIATNLTRPIWRVASLTVAVGPNPRLSILGDVCGLLAVFWGWGPPKALVWSAVEILATFGDWVASRCR